MTVNNHSSVFAVALVHNRLQTSDIIPRRGVMSIRVTLTLFFAAGLSQIGCEWRC